MADTILVLLDGSALAEQALPAAARLARETGAALHVVHVHVPASPDPISIEGMPVVDEQLRSLAAEHERVYLERAAATVAGDGLRPVVARLQGPVTQAITGYAREVGAGLIVMTTRGQGGLAQLLLGSVAESLVRSADTPLLLMRPDSNGSVAAGPFRRVLVPLDGSTTAEAILPHAAALVAADGGELVAARFVDTCPVPTALPFHERFRRDEASIAAERAEAEGYLGELAQRQGQLRVVTAVRESDDPARELGELVRELGADLLALTTHGRGSARTPLGSFSGRALREVALPLLVVRPGEGSVA